MTSWVGSISSDPATILFVAAAVLLIAATIGVLFATHPAARGGANACNASKRSPRRLIDGPCGEAHAEGHQGVYGHADCLFTGVEQNSVSQSRRHPHSGVQRGS
jgi:hypothetical protein